MADELAKAHQAIGAYFCAFSELERELGEALKVVLRLQGNPAADAIVAAVGDFARKARIVQAAVQFAKSTDGAEPEWKAKAVETMRDILGCNNPDRRDLAHDYLEPHPDGSVSLQKPGQPARPWSVAKFERKTRKLKDLTTAVRATTDELTKITIPPDWVAALFTTVPM